MFIGVVSDSQWQSFCAHFGLTELAADETLARNNERVKARKKILPLVRARTATMSKTDLMALCERAGLPYAPIMRPDQLFDDPHLNGSGGFTEITLAHGNTTPVPTLPFEMDGRRFGARLDIPGVGSHTAELLDELGYDGAAVQELEATGVVRRP